MQLDDPTPYLYKESDRLVPQLTHALQSISCSIVDKQVLQKREQVLQSLRRPYHPLFYTTFPSELFICFYITLQFKSFSRSFYNFLYFN